MIYCAKRKITILAIILATLSSLAISVAVTGETIMSKGVSVTVGHKDADVIGSDNVALQAAVDYVAGLGGGTVNIAPGTYLMKDSLHLRSNVNVVGHGESTILRKCDGVSSPLATDGDYGQEAITLVNPAGFEVGMGVAVDTVAGSCT